jgi:hypothetical protein
MFSNSLIQQHSILFIYNMNRLTCHNTIKVVAADSACSVVWFKLVASPAFAELSPRSVDASNAKHGYMVNTKEYGKHGKYKRIPFIPVQGATCPKGALPRGAPLLPVSVRRSASLARCSALLNGDGSQANGLCRLCCEGAMFLDWSIVCCSVLLC